MKCIQDITGHYPGGKGDKKVCRNDIKAEIRQRLFEMQDLKYKEFHKKLIPGVDENKIIGVRTPALRKFAGEVWKEGKADAFVEELPHEYYEENNLHGFLLEKIKDYDECIKKVDRFLPYIDNWATCDSMSPKVLGKYPDRLEQDIRRWIASENTYEIRFGVKMMMSVFLDENFDDEYPALAAGIRSEEYYVNMMIAWYFATALAKQYDRILPYLEEHRLTDWIHRKTIQKAVESYRITDEQKAYLKSLR
ncbi:MAG: DNA alkylation repair protein [Anaerovoracaceae bacterium]